MRKFKSIDLESAEETIKSFERHLGYLSEELVVFFLFVDSVNYAKKNMMGQKLINLPRPKVFTPYKPKTSIVIWRDEEKPFSPSLIGEKLWLLFHLLKLNRPQKCLNLPSEHWKKFEDLNAAKKFLCNLSCVNNIAEQGIKLI